MGIFEKIIKKISPGEITAANAIQSERNYDAAGFGRPNGSAWASVNYSAEETDNMSRDIVRARARDLERNSDFARAVTGAFKRNVAGQGWSLQARTPDEQLNDRLEEYFREWCKPRNCDITEQQSFPQLLRMAVERKKVDGGILFMKCYTAGGLVPFKLQALEVDELDTGRLSPKAKGRRVVGGVELDRHNAHAGYWIRQYSPDGLMEAEPVFVPKKNMIFYYTKRRPSQVREISDFAPTITRIRDANEFMTAVSVKQRVAACLAVFIKKVNGVGAVGRTSRPMPQRDYEGKTITPGMIKELNAGDDISVVNPSGQSADAASFIKLQQRLIGAGQGLSYEATSRDMSQSNYSSARQGLIEDGYTYAEETELLMGTVMDEVYESFVISGTLSGLFDIPDFWENKQAYLKHEWVAAPRKWIDPLKEANAQKIAIMTGQKTFRQIASENGKDWKEQIDEMAEIQEYAAKKGVDLEGIIYGKTNAEGEGNEPVDVEGGKGGNPGH